MCLISINLRAQSPAAGTCTFSGFSQTAATLYTATATNTYAAYVPTGGTTATNGTGLAFVAYCTTAARARLTNNGTSDQSISFTVSSGTLSEAHIMSTSASANASSTSLPSAAGEFKISSLNLKLNTAGAVTITITGYKNGSSVCSQTATPSTTAKYAVTLTAPEWNDVDDIKITGFSATGVSVDDLVIGVAVPVISYSTPQTYTVGTAITTLTPTGSNTVDTYGYSATTTTFATLSGASYSIATDASGNVFVIDYTGKTLKKITSAGVQTTLNSTDMTGPVNIAVDNSGYIYVTDYGSSAVRKFNSSGTLIGTVTGFNTPYGIYADGLGNIFTVDQGTSSVKKFPSSGITGTVTLASILTTSYTSGLNSNIYGITQDASGNMYVSSYTSNTLLKIASGSTSASTMSLTGVALNGPRNMSCDAGGNVYIANYGTNSIVKVSTTNVVSTIVSSLSSPRDVAVDPSGTMYIANSAANNILKDVASGGYAISATLPAGLSFDTSTGAISGTPTASSSATDYTITGYNATGTGTATVNITVNPLMTVTNLTGPTVSPLYYGQTGLVLFGFTLTNNSASAISGTTFVIQAANASNTIFSSGLLYKSTSSTTYPTGFSSAGGTVTFNGTNVTISGLSESIAASSSVNYYLVASFSGTGTVSGTVQLSLSNSSALITAPSSKTPSNSIAGTAFTLATLYNWRGNSTSWTTATSYVTADGATVSGTVPGQYDIVQVGVIAYPGGSSQPTVGTSSSIKELIFGSNSSPALTISSGITLTVTDDVTVNSGASPQIIGPGTLAVTNDLLNNGTNTQQTTAAVTVGGDITNTGTYKQTSTGNMTAATLTNSGTYQQSSSGTLSLSGNFSNTGTFSETSSGSITVGGTTTTGNTSTTTLGSALCTFTGDVTNAGTITEGTGGLDFNGTNFNNSGTFIANGTTTLAGNLTNTGNFTPGTAAITFDGTGSTSLSTNTPITFTNLTFTNGTTTLSSGSFLISSSGSLTMSANSILAAGGNLTLVSDATSTGRIAAIPTTSSITGNVNVQRYFTGGTTTTRGYRLVSSPVNSNSVTSGGSSAYFTMSNLSNLYTGGPLGTSGGFSTTVTGTSTVFLYREDITPVVSGSTSTSFNNGNYKGFTTLNTTPFSVFQSGGTYSLYTGNGIMFYYAGSNSGTNFSSVKTPDNAVATFSGTLNQGSINVKLWYNASTNFTYTSTSGLATGFALVGNPYASSIDLNSFSRTSSTAGVYSPGSGTTYGSSTGLNGTFYQYNYTTKNFDTYQAFNATGTGPVAGTATGSASRYVPSGQGFFVRAYNSNAILTFNEAAKVTNQPTTLLMGLPSVSTSTVQLLRVKFSQDAINNQDIVILFENTATNGYDDGVDADHLGGIGNSAGLYSYARNSGVPLSINHMHTIDSLTRIKLAFTGSSAGTDTLSGLGFDSLDPRYDVYLIDHYKKDSIIFTTANKYLFNINLADTASFGSTRFELAFHKKTYLTKYKLLSFTASKVTSSLQAANTGILLTWKVENEDKLTGFTIQRADGSLQFLSIYSLQSDGSGTYTYTDRSPLAGVNKYRLMQNAAFDQITYSETITIDATAINNNDNNPITLYPNPVINHLQISIGKNPPARVHITIMSIGSGLVMLSKEVNSNNIQENVTRLAPGTYIVEVSDISTNRVIGRTRFIKL